MLCRGADRISLAVRAPCPGSAGVDLGERLGAGVAVGGGAGARFWVVREVIDEHGGQAGLAGGVELVDHVGEEQDVGRSTADGAGDPPVAGRLALDPGLGVEPAGEQRAQVAGGAVAKEGAFAPLPSRTSRRTADGRPRARRAASSCTS